MNRKLLLAAIAGCGLVATSVHLLRRPAPVTQLDVRIDLRVGHPNSEVTVDGRVVPPPRQEFDVYGNTELLGRGDCTLDTDTLRRVGKRVPLRDLTANSGAPRLTEPTVAETTALLREHLGLAGDLLVDPETAPNGRLQGWFEASDTSERGRELQVSCRMKELDWRTPDGGLDNFVLVDFQQACAPGDAAPERRVVLLRLRSGRDGAYVSGHSASARPVVAGERMTVDTEFHFNVRSCTLGGAVAPGGDPLATVVEGVDHWWVAQFLPGRDLVR